jgi:hypothetical protein
VYRSFKSVHEVFDKVYRQALEAKGQKYMESQATGYLGSSREYLSLIKSVGPKIRDMAVDSVVGPEGRTPVAWVLDPMGLGLVQVNAGASKADLVTLAKKFYEM